MHKGSVTRWPYPTQFILIEIKVLKDEKRKLEAYIEAMKEEQLESRSQVEELQEKLADQYEQYRDQVRSLIISQVQSSWCCSY